LSARPYHQKVSAFEVISARAGLAGAPYGAMVEIADRCNEACVHCYQVQGQRGEISTEQWKTIFKELAEMGVMMLTISGGEPTLRKDFLELVAHARQLRFAVRVYSNALNITEELAQQLGELAVQEVQVSLYSHRAEVHDGVTRVKGSFAKVETAARALRKAGVRVVLKSPLMQSNAPEYSEYIAFVQSLGAEFSLDPKLNPREDGDFAPTKLGISKQTYLALCSDPVLGKQHRPRPQTGPRKPCGACNGNVHIEANGELHPCTLWNVDTGNALNGGLRQAWHADPVANVIRSLSWDDLPACSVCDLQSHCSRCFAEAEHYTGHALAAYARACRTARWRYELATGVEPEIDSGDASCDAAPIGPFRNAGEHRFSVQRSDSAQGSGPQRDWLPSKATSAAASHMTPVQLVQIRRHKGAPLTPATPVPSDQ
jgi:radical SAM protein with 4Fe4S-binding SPASM domain